MKTEIVEQNRLCRSVDKSYESKFIVTISTRHLAEKSG